VNPGDGKTPPSKTPSGTSSSVTKAKKKVPVPKFSVTAKTKGKIKVTCKKVKGATKYQIAYRLKNSKKWTTIKASAKTTKLIKAKKGKTYYVRVRAYKGKYGAWSKAKKIKVKR
jgi:hypothetical protein